MHNTPTPVQVGAETGYVSSAATTLDGSGNSTATIETSTVPEGFYMTVVPNILEDNNVLLQYNVSLSNIEQIVTFEASDDTKVQLPEVTSRSFSQKVRMQMGQTLVLGGFEQTVLAESNGYGILSGGSSNEELKRIIIIIISIDSAGE
jgi:type II secretory pathway component GspD/PulD (secretin)